MTNTNPEDIEKAKQKLRREIAVRLLESSLQGGMSIPDEKTTTRIIVSITDALLAELKRTE
jgi:hypothetical protein